MERLNEYDWVAQVARLVPEARFRRGPYAYDGDHRVHVFAGGFNRCYRVGKTQPLQVAAEVEAWGKRES